MPGLVERVFAKSRGLGCLSLSHHCQSGVVCLGQSAKLAIISWCGDVPMATLRSLVGSPKLKVFSYSVSLPASYSVQWVFDFGSRSGSLLEYESI